MNKEPIIPQSTELWTFDQLLERSLQELRKSLASMEVVVDGKPAGDQLNLGVNSIVVGHISDSAKLIKDAKEGE